MSIDEERRQRGPVFLPRDGYRRQRLADTLRIWPFVGLVLIALPVFWGVGVHSSVAAMLYLFGVWAVLIIGCAVLARMMRRMSADDERPPH